MKLEDLKQIEFVKVDVREIESRLITSCERHLNRTLAKGDPIRLLLEGVAYQFLLMLNEINYTGKQNLLAYARGDYLDHLGVLVGVARLLAKRAVTTVRFMLSTERKGLVIPKGTRVSAGDNVFFAVPNDIVVPDGKLQVEAAVYCTRDGNVGNGYVAGQINKLVDPIPYVQSVTNITTSEGGADLEDDENFRMRIQKAPESFSCAGPSGAYEYHAKLTNQDIESVSVISPKPGEVEIRVLMKAGGIPETEVINQVKASCNDKRVRPLTDKVSVLAPSTLTYKVDVTYWINRNNVSMEAETKRRVEEAVKAFTLWQRSALGRDINPSELITRMVQAGAKRVEVRQPVHQEVPATSVAICDDPQFSYGGLEDE